MNLPHIVNTADKAFATHVVNGPNSMDNEDNMFNRSIITTRQLRCQVVSQASVEVRTVGKICRTIVTVAVAVIVVLNHCLEVIRGQF